MLILKFKQVQLSANQHQSVFLYVAFTRVGPKGDKGLSVYETTEGVFYCCRTRASLKEALLQWTYPTGRQGTMKHQALSISVVTCPACPSPNILFEDISCWGF